MFFNAFLYTKLIFVKNVKNSYKKLLLHKKFP